MINQPMPGLTPEAGDKRYLKTTGGTMSGDIAMGGKKVTGLGTPTADGDAVNKKYVDSKLKFQWYDTNMSGSLTKSAGLWQTLFFRITISSSNYIYTTCRLVGYSTGASYVRASAGVANGGTLGENTIMFAPEVSSNKWRVKSYYANFEAQNIELVGQD